MKKQNSKKDERIVLLSKIFLFILGFILGGIITYYAVTHS